jgi:hypothetical protein
VTSPPRGLFGHGFARPARLSGHVRSRLFVGGVLADVAIGVTFQRGQLFDAAMTSTCANCPPNAAAQPIVVLKLEFRNAKRQVLAENLSKSSDHALLDERSAAFNGLSGLVGPATVLSGPRWMVVSVQRELVSVKAHVTKTQPALGHD